MLPRAYVVHRSRQRVRLRVPEKKGDAGWFRDAALALERLDWVDAVETRPASASLAIRCLSTDGVEARLERSGQFRFQADPPPLPTVDQQVRIGMERLDRLLRDSASEEANLRSLLFLVMLILAGIQMTRGQVMVPAVSLLWYAMELVLAGRKPVPGDAEDDGRS